MSYRRSASLRSRSVRAFVAKSTSRWRFQPDETIVVLGDDVGQLGDPSLGITFNQLDFSGIGNIDLVGLTANAAATLIAFGQPLRATRAGTRS